MLRGTKILFSWKLDLWTRGDSWGTAAVHLWKFTAQASQERRKASRDGGADETESEGKGDHLQSPKPAPGLRRKTSPYKLYKPHGLNAVRFVETTPTMDWSLPAAFCWIVLRSWHEVFGQAQQCPLRKCNIDWRSCLFVGQANTAEGCGTMARPTPTKRMRTPVETIWTRKQDDQKRQGLLERSTVLRLPSDRSALLSSPTKFSKRPFAM